MRNRIRATSVLATVLIAFCGVGVGQAIELPANDYPTEARADYVFGCMAVNGQTRAILRRCSCSIDKIAELLPYEKYEEAETVMSVIRKGGEKVAILRSPQIKRKVDNLKRAQVEAELLCF